jgi:hypothetical protein
LLWSLFRKASTSRSFISKGSSTSGSFAVLASYDQCDESAYVQINFAEQSKVQIQESIWINDSEQPCEENEPQCFRK